MHYTLDINNLQHRRAMGIIRRAADILALHLNGAEYDLLRDRIGSGVGGVCTAQHLEAAQVILRRVRQDIDTIDNMDLVSTSLTAIQEALMALQMLATPAVAVA